MDLRRKRVRIDHTAARVETMKRVLQNGCVSTSYNGSALALGREHLQDRGWGEPICFLVDIDKVCLV